MAYSSDDTIQYKNKFPQYNQIQLKRKLSTIFSNYIDYFISFKIPNTYFLFTPESVYHIFIQYVLPTMYLNLLQFVYLGQVHSLDKIEFLSDMYCTYFVPKQAHIISFNM